MPRYIAFLRAINVGGHNVTMEKLRGLFAGLAFKGVETFIASGNVIFESPSRDTGALEKKIEDRLYRSLGYEVKSFLRSDVEVAAIARYTPFEQSAVACAGANVVAFLAEPLTTEAVNVLMTLKTEFDQFQLNGRELYWLCTRKASEATFTNSVFEKRLKVRTTFRGVNTVRRLSAKYPPR